MEFSTKVLHEKTPAPQGKTNATLPPIAQTSAFSCETAEELEKIFSGKAPGFAYTRIGNPTVDAFERKICGLEGGICATACSSGMAAITSTLLNILQSGDEVVANSGLFGGTLDLLDDLAAYGITTRFVRHACTEEIEALVTDKTRVIFAEIISNPGLDVMDISSVAHLAHSRGIPLVVDATSVTPFMVNPIRYGADIVIHSASKYINGSGNSVGGIIVDGGRFDWNTDKFHALAKFQGYGNFAFSARLRNDIWRNIGGCLSPMNAYLNLLGLETLALRMERICDNALALSKALEESSLAEVNYPGLSGNGFHRLVQEQFAGRGGGIVTIRVGTKERAYQVMNKLKFALKATNIGDTKTLVIHPASTIYAHSSSAQKAAAGVFDDLIRISVGIEAEADLIQDFTQALEA